MRTSDQQLPGIEFVEQMRDCDGANVAGHLENLQSTIEFSRYDIHHGNHQKTG